MSQNAYFDNYIQIDIKNWPGISPKWTKWTQKWPKLKLFKNVWKYRKNKNRTKILKHDPEKFKLTHIINIGKKIIRNKGLKCRKTKFTRKNTKMAKIPKIDWKCSNWFQIFHNVWKYENNVYPKYNLSGRNKPIKMVQNISKLTPKLIFWKRWKFSKSLKIDLKFIHMAKITLNCSKWRQKCKFWKPWISKNV